MKIQIEAEPDAVRTVIMVLEHALAMGQRNRAEWGAEWEERTFVAAMDREIDAELSAFVDALKASFPGE